MLGKTLVHMDGGLRRSGRIVETEAYLANDLASHARSGPGGRAAIMWGLPGVAYVYLIYGLHHCFNAVTEPEGTPGAVLVRALEPLENIERANGPALVCQALHITRSQSGDDLVGPEQTSPECDACCGDPSASAHSDVGEAASRQGDPSADGAALALSGPSSGTLGEADAPRDGSAPAHGRVGGATSHHDHLAPARSASRSASSREADAPRDLTAPARSDSSREADEPRDPSFDHSAPAHRALDKKACQALFIEDAAPVPDEAVRVGPRIGVAYAGEWASRPFRFWIADSPHVSRNRVTGTTFNSAMLRLSAKGGNGANETKVPHA